MATRGIHTKLMNYLVPKPRPPHLEFTQSPVTQSSAGQLSKYFNNFLGTKPQTSLRGRGLDPRSHYHNAPLPPLQAIKALVWPLSSEMVPVQDKARVTNTFFYSVTLPLSLSLSVSAVSTQRDTQGCSSSSSRLICIINNASRDETSDQRASSITPRNAI